MIQQDNWVVKQVRNCATALVGALVSSPHPNQVNAYLDSATLVIVASTNGAFFTNPFTADCGAITVNSLYDAGCSNSYSGGNLIITANYG